MKLSYVSDVTYNQQFIKAHSITRSTTHVGQSAKLLLMDSLIDLESSFPMAFVMIFLSTENAATSTLTPTAPCASSLCSEIWEGEGEVFAREGGGGFVNSEAKGLDIRGTLAGLEEVDDVVPGRGGSGGLEG